ncbi:cation-transporting P-type ATPase [Parvibaculum sp.]
MQTKLTRPSGLNKTQVKERLARFGSNQLFVPAPPRCASGRSPPRKSENP